VNSDELRALVLGYATAVDTLDGPGFAGLFTEDGELWVPDPTRGPDPVVCRAGAEALGRIPSGLARYRSTHHVVWSATYDRDDDGGDDGAIGVVSGVAHHLAATPDGPAGAEGPGTDTVWYIRYEDRYRRTVDGWRIARRALHLRGLEVRQLSHLGPGR